MEAAFAALRNIQVVLGLVDSSAPMGPTGTTAGDRAPAFPCIAYGRFHPSRTGASCRPPTTGGLECAKIHEFRQGNRVSNRQQLRRGPWTNLIYRIGDDLY
jgi:hypothetical protein